MSELQQLRDRVAELEDLLGLGDLPPLRQILRPEKDCWLQTCDPLAALLLKRQCITREAAYTVLYGGRREPDQPAFKIIDVVASRLRLALARHGITFETNFGHGWYMTEDNKAKLRALIEAHK